MIALAVLLPLLAALILGFTLTPLRGAYANLAVSALLFLLTLAVPASPGAGLLHADPLAMIFGILTGFVGLTPAVTNIAFVRAERQQLSLRSWRVYHACAQALLGATLLGLYADNIGLLWVAVEGATIAATLRASACRAPPPRWKPPGNISSSAASASRSRCSAPCWSISPPSRHSARACRP